MNVDHRASLSLVLAAMLVLVAGSSFALDQRSEATAKEQKIQPKALNPQPEVPSKGEKMSPKALNPQPEVPSKPKKKKKAEKKGIRPNE